MKTLLELALAVIVTVLGATVLRRLTHGAARPAFRRSPASPTIPGWSWGHAPAALVIGMAVWFGISVWMLHDRWSVRDRKERMEKFLGQPVVSAAATTPPRVTQGASFKVFAKQADEFLEDLNKGRVHFAEEKVQLLTFLDQSMHKLEQYDKVLTGQRLPVEERDFGLTSYVWYLWPDDQQVRSREEFSLTCVNLQAEPEFEFRESSAIADMKFDRLIGVRCWYLTSKGDSLSARASAARVDSVGTLGGTGSIVRATLRGVLPGQKVVLVFEYTRPWTGLPPISGMMFDPRSYPQLETIVFHVALRGPALYTWTPGFNAIANRFELFEHPCQVEEFHSTSEPKTIFGGWTDSVGKWHPYVLYCAAYSFRGCPRQPVVFLFDEKRSSLRELFVDREYVKPNAPIASAEDQAPTPPGSQQPAPKAKASTGD